MMMPEIQKAHARFTTFYGCGFDRGPAYWLWLSLGLFPGSWLELASVLLSPHACCEDAFRGFPQETVGPDRARRRKHFYATRAAKLVYVREVGGLTPTMVVHLYRKIAVPSFEYSVPSTLLDKSLVTLSNV